MSTKIKLYLGHKVIECLEGKLKILPTELKSYFRVGNETDKNFQILLPVKAIENHFNVPKATELLNIKPDKEVINKVYEIHERKSKSICFDIDKNLFVKDVIDNCVQPYINYHPKHVVVEFSSPNIAKPFHLGHLRSTIIGNFISNLYAYFQNNVIRLNYLGDWGTQFGFIKVGLEELKYSRSDLETNPIKLLYESYVHANSLAKNDAEIANRARKEFSKLETGLVEMEDWKLIIDYTKEELSKTYERLSVRFDEYHMESMYNINDIQNVINQLKENNILQLQDDGKQTATVNDRKVPLLKSDGTSLYLTRDIAAAIDRFSKYKFDRMFYLADNSQHNHFTALKCILRQLQLPWEDKIEHVKFGRVRGMSSRKGNAVFLKDILDECRELMVEKQINSPTTRVPVTDSNVSDILGVSCVVINDLKQRRLRDYEFSWDKVLQSQGDTGIKLQYTHCRLCSLEENCGVIAAQCCNPELLLEQEAMSLIKEIARFHEVLYSAQEQLEACILVNYLFNLCNHINKALKRLNVKGAEEEIGAQRLLLFNSARAVLNEGMTILGLKPLTKM